MPVLVSVQSCDFSVEFLCESLQGEDGVALESPD
jgi:hypothetical protein